MVHLSVLAGTSAWSCFKATAASVCIWENNPTWYLAGGSSVWSKRSVAHSILCADAHSGLVQQLVLTHGVEVVSQPSFLQVLTAPFSLLFVCGACKILFVGCPCVSPSARQSRAREFPSKILFVDRGGQRGRCGPGPPGGLSPLTVIVMVLWLSGHSSP